jgi:hypothetical protein
VCIHTVYRPGRLGPCENARDPTIGIINPSVRVSGVPHSCGMRSGGVTSLTDSAVACAGVTVAAIQSWDTSVGSDFAPRNMREPCAKPGTISMRQGIRICVVPGRNRWLGQRTSDEFVHRKGVEPEISRPFQQGSSPVGAPSLITPLNIGPIWSSAA